MAAPSCLCQGHGQLRVFGGFRGRSQGLHGTAGGVHQHPASPFLVVTAPGDLGSTPLVDTKAEGFCSALHQDHRGPRAIGVLGSPPRSW